MKKFVSMLLMVVALFTFSIGASAKTVSKNDLTSSQALNLAVSAQQHYWNISIGMNTKLPHKDGEMKTFMYKGMEYRYFSKEFSTKKKLVAYMNEVYTLNAIERAFKNHNFITYKGKLAQPNADGGSLLEWNKAKVKLLYQRKDVRLYQFTVPYGERVEYTKKNVTFVKVHNKWFINNFDAVR
ncbi:MAG: IseA DL-endopeptidase inhibitor family protein [Heyndrickxia sp.]